MMDIFSEMNVLDYQGNLSGTDRIERPSEQIPKQAQDFPSDLLNTSFKNILESASNITLSSTIKIPNGKLSFFPDTSQSVDLINSGLNMNESIRNEFLMSSKIWLFQLDLAEKYRSQMIQEYGNLSGYVAIFKLFLTTPQNEHPVSTEETAILFNLEDMNSRRTLATFLCQRNKSHPFTSDTKITAVRRFLTQSQGRLPDRFALETEELVEATRSFNVTLLSESDGIFRTSSPQDSATLSLSLSAHPILLTNQHHSCFLIPASTLGSYNVFLNVFSAALDKFVSLVYPDFEPNTAPEITSNDATSIAVAKYITTPNDISPHAPPTPFHIVVIPSLNVNAISRDAPCRKSPQSFSRNTDRALDHGTAIVVDTKSRDFMFPLILPVTTLPSPFADLSWIVFRSSRLPASKHDRKDGKVTINDRMYQCTTIRLALATAAHADLLPYMTQLALYPQKSEITSNPASLYALSSPLTLPPLFQPPAPPPSMSTSKRGSSNTRSSATVCSLHASVMLSAIPHSNPLTSLKMCNKSSTSNCIKCVRYCQLGRSILSYSKHPHTALTLTELVAIVCVVHTIFHISVLYTLPYSLYITVSAIHNGTMSLTLFIPHPSHSFTVIRLPYYYKKAKDKPGWP